MTAQWERVRAGDFDYDERWDYAGDGYVRVFIHRRIENVCETCGKRYRHFFVSHRDWAKVPTSLRSLRLCIDCYAEVS